MDALYDYLDEKYQELTVLGNHDKSATWLAQHTDTGQIVVKKYISQKNAGIYERLKMLENQHFTRILQVAEGKQNAIVIMEYISGQTLAQCMEDGLFSSEDTIDYIIQILNGLCEIHKQGIVHRDVNPKNVLISTDGVVKILDFDIGRVYKENQGKDTQILGTKGYAAPEQFGFLQSDARADIYAVGVLMNEMLTGKEPQEELCEDQALQAIVQKCTQIDPQKRYQTDEELLYELKRLQKSKYGDACHEGEPESAGERGGFMHPPLRRMENEAWQLPLRRMGKEAWQRLTRPEETSVKRIWPGFRTGVTWKKIIAMGYYIIMGLYSAGCMLQCMGNLPAAVLEMAALIIYVWLAAFLPMNFMQWMDRCWGIRRLKRRGKMIFGIVLWTALFMIGFELDQFVSGQLLHIAG